MRRNIRYGFVAALAAVAISAASAAAAPPAWFDGADRNRDGRVTWSEYVRNDVVFDVLDENGDGLITRSEEFGKSPTSSWMQVASLDSNRDGVVTQFEYARRLRTSFDTYDANDDGTLSEREADGTRRARSERGAREGARAFGSRGPAPPAGR
jgi:Ca2+-binding EF-hand superfamily protein